MICLFAYGMLVLILRDDSSRGVMKSIKERLESIYKFFQEDPLGKKIIKLVKDWKETMKDEIKLIILNTNCIFFRLNSVMVTREQMKCIVPRYQKSP
ncbi:Antigen B [Echinococcus granulosus]|uniref:Antigen B n=1 Tax=Echinococcus granulosus TaxID=6210 RepID=W6UJI9_ECHGR|nr:Antigen B [Echinococcus granulosus]EUB61213.1 Antigen B [Echinococcus granulosus]